VFRWLLNTIPSWAIVILVVGGLMAIAAVGLVVVRRRWPQFVDGEHNDVAGILLGVVGATYGIMLAFVIVAVYEDFSDAQSTVHSEATALAELYRDTRGMDIADPMNGAIGGYVRAVVDEDWPMMADGRLSDRGWAGVDAMFAVLQGFEPATQSQDAFLGAAIDDLNQVVEGRRARLFHAQEALPGMLQALMIGGAVLLIAFTWLFGMRLFRTQVLMVVGVAGLIGFSVVLAMMIDHPFSGDLSVSSDPFTEGILGNLSPP
jgi:hypothetical protein